MMCNTPKPTLENQTSDEISSTHGAERILRVGIFCAAPLCCAMWWQDMVAREFRAL